MIGPMASMSGGPVMVYVGSEIVAIRTGMSPPTDHVAANGGAQRSGAVSVWILAGSAQGAGHDQERTDSPRQLRRSPYRSYETNDVRGRRHVWRPPTGVRREVPYPYAGGGRRS